MLIMLWHEYLNIRFVNHTTRWAVPHRSYFCCPWAITLDEGIGYALDRYGSKRAEEAKKIYDKGYRMKNKLRRYHRNFIPRCILPD